MKRIFKDILLLIVLGLISVACNINKAATPNTSSGDEPSSSAGSSDQQFLADAAQGNQAEIELGRLMARKAKDPEVRKFAEMMVVDHSMALNQLQQLAQSKNITLPTDLPNNAQDLKQKLSSESGKQLEKDYIQNMVQDHQKDVLEFQEASQKLKDPDAKQWASKALPTLQNHLQKAQEIASKISG